MKWLTSLFIVVASILLSCCSQKKDTRLIGIKIYDYQGEYNTLAAKWKEMGINTAFVSKDLAMRPDFRTALDKRDIQVYIIFPVFQDPDALAKDSTLFAVTDKGSPAIDSWVRFICPSRKAFRNEKISELSELVNTLDPDGVSIDFIRHFVFWEMVYPGHDPDDFDRTCYCDSCIAAFSRQFAIEYPDTGKTVPGLARWIEINHAESWQRFRCEQVTTMMKSLAEAARLVKPGIRINFHAVPWRTGDFNEAGRRIAAQDISQVSEYSDFISPMCYSQMVKRDAGWISDVVADMDNKAGGKILPSIQVYPYYNDQKFSVDDFSRCLKAALEPPSVGVIFFSWPLFEKDSARMDAVARITGGGY